KARAMGLVLRLPYRDDGDDDHA
ncbi:MAG: hypothetical protein RLZ26_1515, partial [Pseudomonadota bacterium]